MSNNGLKLGKVSTATLIEADYKLEATCQGCARWVVLEPYELRKMFPKALRLDQASDKLRCKGCGRNHPKMWIWVMGWTREKRRRG